MGVVLIFFFSLSSSSSTFFFLFVCRERPHVKDIFQACAAKVGAEPCCDWVGDAGAGHFVKMVHNGIEYGDMQLIAEAYSLMKNGLGMTPDEMSEVFAEWNKGELDSFLIEITRDILGWWALPKKTKKRERERERERERRMDE